MSVLINCKLRRPIARFSSPIGGAICLLLLSHFASGCIGAATPEEEAATSSAITATSTPVAATPTKATNKLPGAQATASDENVVDPIKCPEKTPGGGDGDLQGGMCIYTMPIGGCSILGADCNKVYNEDKCRCPTASLSGGGPGSDPAQVLTD
jgi:hypothetical protein